MIKDIKEMVALLCIQSIGLLYVQNVMFFGVMSAVIAWQWIRIAQHCNRPAKKQREGYKKLSCDIPTELHKLLKSYTATHKMTITRYITELLTYELGYVSGVTTESKAETKEYIAKG